MLAAAALVAVGTFAGTMAAQAQASVIAGMAAWAFLCGLLVARGRAAGAIGLVATLAFVLVTERPLEAGDALEYAGLVLAGGTVQALQRWIAWPPDRELPLTLGFVDERSAALRRGVLMGLALGAAVTTYRLPSAGGHAYWVAATALFILRPGYGSVLDSVVARYLGTVVAVGAVTAATAEVAPTRAVLIVLAAIVAVLAYTLFQVNFALFTASMSSLLILLAAIGGLPPSSAATDFMLDATLGAVIAMLAYGLLATGALGRRLQVQPARVA